MISANEPFLGGCRVAFGVFANCADGPFEIFEDVVGVCVTGVRLLVEPLSFIRAIDVSTPGLPLGFEGRELLAGLEEPPLVFCILSAGRRRASPSEEDLRFGGGNKERFVCVGLGSPEIEARRSPICAEKCC